MNAEALLAALNLPVSCRLDRREPKKLLLVNGAPTAADKRRINEGIEEFFWIAALKPTTIGVPEYRDAEREYVEIAVLRVILRAGAKTTRLLELVHRAVPYPLLLIAEQTGRTIISTVHKRRAKSEADKTVLDGEIVVADCDIDLDAGFLPAFFAALALERQSHASLYSLYQGWTDTLFALKAARLTGVFSLFSDVGRTTARQEALRECVRLDVEIARLRAAAAGEKQMPRQVELNMEIRRMEAAMVLVKERL